MARARHYAGTYQVDARNVKHAATANPLTLCWRCHRTLDQHPPHHNGNPAYWTAGHTQHGSTTAQPWTAPLITRAHCDQAAHGDYLAPEASVCNYGAKDSTPVERIATTRHW